MSVEGGQKPGVVLREEEKRSKGWVEAYKVCCVGNEMTTARKKKSHRFKQDWLVRYY